MTAGLEHLVVEGLGPIRRVELDLTTDITVLIGANGSGKSNLVSALELVAQTEKDIITPFTTLKGDDTLYKDSSSGILFEVFYACVSYFNETKRNSHYSLFEAANKFLKRWIRGDYIPSDPTLTRFFMLHVCLLPLVLLVVIVIHFYSLRIPHVNNETGEEIDFEVEAEKYLSGDKKNAKVIPFWPGFLAKDFMYIGFFCRFPECCGCTRRHGFLFLRQRQTVERVV